jgi:nitrogen fixation NifU-like protein
LTEAEWKALVLDHYKQPRAYGAVDGARFKVEEHNRTCGDHVTLFAFASAEQKDLLSLKFTGQGCSLSMASASLMAELLQDRDRDGFAAVLAKFQEVRKEGAKPGDPPTWQVISGLRQYPVRSRCVCLAWQGLEKILEEWT